MAEEEVGLMGRSDLRTGVVKSTIQEPRLVSRLIGGMGRDLPVGDRPRPRGRSLIVPRVTGTSLDPDE